VVGYSKVMRFMLAFSFVIALAPASGQVSDGPKWLVPQVVEHKFNIEHPEASARWKKDGMTYSAQFINPLNNLGSIIVYDTAGKVVRRDKELENNEYPAPINDYFIRKFPDEGYTVWSTTDSAGNTNFYSMKNDRMLKFDKEGRLVSPVSLRPGNDTVSVESAK
jgi:hypothetical protein